MKRRSVAAELLPCWDLQSKEKQNDSKPPTNLGSSQQRGAMWLHKAFSSERIRHTTLQSAVAPYHKEHAQLST